MYAEAADFIANKNPKIFYIRGDAKYYRYEFNFVLCWLLQDMIGREMRRHNNKNFRKASLYNSDNKLKVLKKKQILKEKEKRKKLTATHILNQGQFIMKIWRKSHYVFKKIYQHHQSPKLKSAQ